MRLNVLMPEFGTLFIVERRLHFGHVFDSRIQNSCKDVHFVDRDGTAQFMRNMNFENSSMRAFATAMFSNQSGFNYAQTLRETLW